MTDLQQRSFQEFMLRGTKGRTTSAESSSSPRNNNEATQQVVWKKAERKYWQILKAYQGTLERDWLDVDDNLGQVVSSISHLRDRIVMESRFLVKANDAVRRKPWDGYGYREKNEDLSMDDVELTMSSDILKQERMMAGARTLLASLSQGQDALGRRLEEMMLHHMEQQQYDGVSGLDTTWSSVVDTLQSVFSSLAVELYRKQVLVQSVLDSVNDNMLSSPQEDDGEVVGVDVNPRRVAERCAREWPRVSKASHVDVKMLNGLLLLGDKSGTENN